MPGNPFTEAARWLGEPLASVTALAVAGIAGLAVHRVLFTLLPRALRAIPTGLDDALLTRLRRPSRVVIPLVCLRIAIGGLGGGVEREWLGAAGRIASVGLILGLTWAAVAAVRAFSDWLRSRHDVSVADNLEARRIHTQVDVLATSLVIVIGVVGVAIALMQFHQVREIGASLLASAGIAGLAIGIAARPVLGNLIAGVQIAFSEPIRIDDVVVVEGEWGRIEEITSTYVVVRVWDERRLVVPLSYFLENSFQNWTRETARVTGTVFLHLDWRVPVDEVREELRRACEAHEDWDGRVAAVQVTDTSAEGIEVRGLVSAADASRLWNLRCDVRERLVAFLRREHPDALPVVRGELRQPAGPAPA